jgi:hypothetical protein
MMSLMRAGDVYHMWDPRTSCVHETRDVIWLRRIFYEKASQNVKIATPVKLNIDVHDDVEPLTVEAGEEENDDGDDVIDASDEVDDKEENLKEEKTNDDKAGSATCSGRAISHPTRLIEKMGATVNNI